jgi:two-component system phosphate regulon sensor histidine kinase PhoR
MSPESGPTPPARRRRVSPLAESWRPDISGEPILHGPLRRRLAIPFIATFVVILVILGAFLGYRARDVYLERLTIEMEVQARILADDVGRALAAGATPAEIQELVTSISPDLANRLTIVAADGTVLADNEHDPTTMVNHANRPEIIDALSQGEGRATRLSRTLDEHFLYLAVPIAGGGGAVARVAAPLDDVDATVRTQWLWMTIAMAVAIAMVMAIAWFIAGRIVRPLENLRSHAHAVARGDLAARIDPMAPEEFAEVGYAFNRMSEELETSRDALIQARSRLEAVLAELADGVVITDETGHVLRMNAAAETLLGAREESSIGKPFLQVCRDHELSQILQATLTGLTHSEAAIEHGLNRHTLLTTAQIVEDGRERLGLVVLRDISELRRLETVRREFVANVSHELRTPLTSIRAMVETLEAGAIDDPEITTDFLGRIVSEVDRLTALVEDLLDLARLEAGRTTLKYDRVDPGDLVRQGADRLRTQIERAQLTMEATAAEGMQAIPVDRARMEQVLINLLHTAIKFTPAGGDIRLRVSQDATETTIEVEDTGIGIEPGEQIRLFERFYKSDKARRSDGTGLGLAIAKHIIQAHGGTIAVKSAPGEGSTFRIVLPNKRPKASRRRP